MTHPLSSDECGPATITPPITLEAYLEEEVRLQAESQHRFRPELDGFSALADPYEKLGAAIHLRRPELALPAKLFLVVRTQMYSVGSQLLRCRVADAHALTRHAIGATASAYRLWEHPELRQVFVLGYPKVWGGPHSTPKAVGTFQGIRGRVLHRQTV